MLDEMVKSLKEFRSSEPGNRFKQRYRRRQESESGWTDPRRLFNVIVGVILVVGSAFFGWAPGPGMLTFFIGLAMIGGEFRFAAHFLDWAEIRSRKAWRIITKLWHSSAGGKALVLASALITVSIPAYAIYRLFFGG
ncbi:hypothetical protein BH23ACT11_BH23ACT11_31150 [soil metagenome]